MNRKQAEELAYKDWGLHSCTISAISSSELRRVAGDRYKSEWHELTAEELLDLGASFGDVDSYYADKENGPFYVVPRYAQGGDYSGSLVERSNYNVLTDEFDGMVVCLHGGYGSFGIAIPIDWLASEDGNTCLEMLQGLEDYPLIDEDEYSKLEMEASQEAWESWAESDYLRELEKKFDVEDIGDHIEDVAAAFHAVADRIGEYWINESGGNSRIDVEEVAAATTLEDLGLTRYRIRKARKQQEAEEMNREVEREDWHMVLHGDRRVTAVRLGRFQQITRYELVSMGRGDVAYVRGIGQLVAYPVRGNGACKVWKKDGRARWPWKYGLREYGAVKFERDGETCYRPAYRLLEEFEVEIGRARKVTVRITGSDVGIGANSEPIEARSVDGTFGLHRSLGGGGWTVTHLRSGLWAVSGSYVRCLLALHRIWEASSGNPSRYLDADRDRGVLADLAAVLGR